MASVIGKVYFAPLTAVDWTRAPADGGGYAMVNGEKGALDELTALIKVPARAKVFASADGTLMMDAATGMMQLEETGDSSRTARRWRYFDIDPSDHSGPLTVDASRVITTPKGTLLGFSKGPTFRLGLIDNVDMDASVASSNSSVDPVQWLKDLPAGQLVTKEAEKIAQAIGDVAQGATTATSTAIAPTSQNSSSSAPATINVMPGTMTISKVGLAAGLIGTALVGGIVGVIIAKSSKSMKKGKGKR